MRDIVILRALRVTSIESGICGHCGLLGGSCGHWILILTFHRVPMELQVLGVPKVPVDQR